MKLMQSFPLTLITLFFLFASNKGICQTKMVIAEKHTVFIDVPSGWLQVPIDGVQLFLRPYQDSIIDEETYMYVLGLDYRSTPNLNEWIDANTTYLKETSKDVVDDSLSITFDNIKNNGYLTGRYKTISYTYSDGRKEVLLIIECNYSIVTVVISTKNEQSLEKNLSSFKQFAQSIKILETTVEKE